MADSPPRRKPRLELEAATATATAPDLLSPLPLEVLDKILSRLHIYEVVRTSALSRAWRRRWETLPTVNLARGPYIDAHDVDALLLRRTAPLRTFRLVPFRSWYVDALHDWLLYLSRNGVETLLLYFPTPGFQLHSSLFSCRELTSLDLSSCRLPPAPPDFDGFPCLKELCLRKVAIPEHGGRRLAALIAASPSIEKVELLMVELVGDDPEAEDEWVIRAPYLRELTIAGHFPYGGRVDDLPRLKSGVLCGCNYAKFLMGMSQIAELEFTCGPNWFAEVDVLDRLPCLFENLRRILISVDFTKMSPILSFFCLLRSAPVLEELIVCGWSEGSQDVNADDNFLNAQWVDGMFAKLHVVRMKNILCFSNEMHFIEFILSKARVLQVLSVRLGPDALCSNEEAVVTIKEYPTASSDAKIIFLGSESANTGPINTSTEDAAVEETTFRGHDSVFVSATNAEGEETRTGGSDHGSIAPATVNAEAEETQSAGSESHSVNVSTDNAKMDETQTTGSVHELSIENAELEETLAQGTERGFISASTEDAEAEETKMTGSGCRSINLSTENAKVDETKIPGSRHESLNMSTETTEVEETQTTASEQVHDVRPWSRKMLDLESVAQLEQLEDEIRELQERIRLHLDCKRLELDNRMQMLDCAVKNLNMRPYLEKICERGNISLPPFPEPSSFLSSLMATSRIGDSVVNLSVNVASSAHADSSENHGANGPDNAHVDPQEDHNINGTSNIHATSSEGQA